MNKKQFGWISSSQWCVKKNRTWFSDNIVNKTGQDRTRQDKTGQDRTRQNKTGQYRTRQDKTRKDKKG